MISFETAGHMHCCSWPRLALLALNNTQRNNTKGPLTYGPKSEEEWSQTIIHQKVNGLTSGEEWSKHICKYRQKFTDLSTGRSVTVHIDGRFDSTWENTVDIEGRFDFTYGELRSIVDRR